MQKSLHLIILEFWRVEKWDGEVGLCILHTHQASWLIILWFLVCYISACLKLLYCEVAVRLLRACDCVVIFLPHRQCTKGECVYLFQQDFCHIWSEGLQLHRQQQQCLYLIMSPCFCLPLPLWDHKGNIPPYNKHFKTVEQIKSKQMPVIKCCNTACPRVARRLRMQTEEALIN